MHASSHLLVVGLCSTAGHAPERPAFWPHGIMGWLSHQSACIRVLAVHPRQWNLTEPSISWFAPARPPTGRDLLGRGRGRIRAGGHPSTLADGAAAAAVPASSFRGSNRSLMEEYPGLLESFACRLEAIASRNNEKRKGRTVLTVFGSHGLGDHGFRLNFLSASPPWAVPKKRSCGVG